LKRRPLGKKGRSFTFQKTRSFQTIAPPKIIWLNFNSIDEKGMRLRNESIRADTRKQERAALCENISGQGLEEKTGAKSGIRSARSLKASFS